MPRDKNHEAEHQRGFFQSVPGKLGIALFVILVFLTLSQCTVKKPEAPEWNTNLTVPLVNRTYGMAEILTKLNDDGFGIDSNQQVFFSITEEMDTIQLSSDNLTINPVNYSVTQTLGPIVITAPTVSPVVVDITSIQPLAAAIPGTVPDASFQIDNSLPAITTFSSATFVSGTVYAIVSNNLGLDLDLLDVTLIDESSSLIIATQSFPSGIVDGATDSVAFNLSGETISNSLLVRLDSHTPGGTVLSASNKDITTAVRFGTLTVSSATTQVPALSRNFAQQVAIADSDAIHSATVASGSMAFGTTNTTPLPVTIVATFPDILLSGNPLAVTQNLAPGGSANVTIGLAGYEIAPSDLVVPQQLSVQVTANSAGTGASQVLISQGHQFGVNASLTGLTFDSVTGVFSASSVSIDQQSQTIDVPIGFDAIQLQNAVLTIEIENGVALPGHLTVTVYNDQAETLVLDGPVLARSGLKPAVTLLSDSSVASFLNPLPSSILVSGSATFGDSTTVGSIRSNDYVIARVKIFAPLEMIINQTSVQTDIESLDIEQDDIEAITDHVVTARLYYNITSHLPVGAQVSISLSDDSSSIYLSPLLRLDTIAVAAAPVVGGTVSDTLSTGWQSIVLSSADVQVLENNPLFVGTELLLEDSNGQVVRLTGNDFVKVAARIEIEYRFDGEF